MEINATPKSLEDLIKNNVSGDYKIVLEEVEKTIKETNLKPILINEGRTQGDWQTEFFFTNRDIRPADALSFEIIEQMINSAPVRFAFEMKRSQVLTVFRNERSWKLHCVDEELRTLARANLKRIFPKMSLDFSYSSLVYGTSFQELVWEYKKLKELGLEGDKEVVVAKIPNAVNPATVGYIKRTKKGHFDGFAQYPFQSHTNRVLNQAEEIIVRRDSALVMPYNERFRNLWGESFLKPIYPIWFWYEVVLRSMVRYMERTGTPVAVVKAPSRSTVLKPGTTTRVDGITWGMEIASNVARSNAAVIPSDTDEQGKPLWELSYLTATERSQPFLDILELLTQMILRAGMSADRALSQSSGGVGSYNIGEVHKEATALHNETILTQWVHYLNTYFLPLFSLYNRGVNGPQIWLETQGLDPTDRQNLTTLLGVAQNMESFKDVGFRIDWPTLLETNDVPLIEEEEAEEKKEQLNQEAMDKQEETMKVQSKFQAPPPARTQKNDPGSATTEKKQPNQLESPDIVYEQLWEEAKEVVLEYITTP